MLAHQALRPRLSAPGFSGPLPSEPHFAPLHLWSGHSVTGALKMRSRSDRTTVQTQRTRSFLESVSQKSRDFCDTNLEPARSGQSDQAVGRGVQAERHAKPDVAATARGRAPDAGRGAAELR